MKKFFKILKTTILVVGLITSILWGMFMVFGMIAINTSSSHGSFIDEWLSFQSNCLWISIPVDICALYFVIVLTRYEKKEENKLAHK